MTSNQIICDTDFIIGLYLEQDSNHSKAITIYNKYSQSHNLIILNLTKYEVATVLSRKLPQELAIAINTEFLNTFTQEIFFEKAWEVEVYNLFNSFQKKNISFFDCVCLIYAKKVNAKIASFDQFYPKDLLCQ